MLKAINYKDNHSVKYDFKKLVKEAFPIIEVPPTFRLLHVAKKKSTTLLCFYEENEFVGLAYYIIKDNLLYLLLLAVPKDKRGYGYGEKILDYVKEQNKDKTLFLSYEEINEKADNNPQRIAREKFYINNGVYPIDFKTKEFGVIYQIASSNKDLKLDINIYRSIVSIPFGKILARLFISKER